MTSNSVRAAFAARLAEAMRSKHIGASELARIVGVTPTAVWNWQQGNTHPRPDTLSTIAAALDVDVAHLLYGSFEDDDVSIGDKDSVSSILEDARVQIARLTGIAVESIKVKVEMISG